MPRNKLPSLVLGFVLSIAMMATAAGCVRSGSPPPKAEPASKHVAATDSGVAAATERATKRRLATNTPDGISLPSLDPPSPPKGVESTPQPIRSFTPAEFGPPVELPPAVPDRIEPAGLPSANPKRSPATATSPETQGGNPGLRPNPLRTNEVPGFPTRVVPGEPAKALPVPLPVSVTSPPASADPAAARPATETAPAVPASKPATTVPAANRSAAMVTEASGPLVSGPVIDPGPTESAAVKPAGSPSTDPSAPGVAAGENGSAPLSPGGHASDAPMSLPDLTKPWGKGKHSGIKFDPIKENGDIFQGWKTPEFALLISGRQEGYLEPCGCAGLDRMKGGLSRRYSLCKQLRSDGWPKGSKSPWPLVAVDVGGQVKGYDQQAVFKFVATTEALGKMGYDAVGLGVGELRLPAGDVLVAALDFAGVGQGRFVSANVGVLGDPGTIPQLPTKRIVAAGGKKIGITAVLGANWQSQINNSDLHMSDPAAALPAVLAELKAQHCDLLVLLSHASEQDSIALAKQFPDFDVVVTAGGPPEPPNDKQYVPGTKTLLVTTGEKGMNVIVLGFYDDPQSPIRYQRVPLDSRFDAAREITLVMRNYQAKLQNLMQGAPPKAKPTHPRAELLGKFVGSEKCKECHEGSYKTWLKTPHAQAWETLKSKTNPPRTFDPECISCHAIGWNTTQFFPYDSGFQSEKETPQLINVGCESCHGPGEKHILAEKGKDVALQKKLEDAVIVTKEESEKRQCFTCHDGDNSPDFDFKAYWPRIAHKDDKD
jgi:hypothetical protein